MKNVETRYVAANIPVFLIRCLAAALVDLGFDPERPLVGTGITTNDLVDPACRISFRQGRMIIMRALKIARGHALGLETGLRERITTLGVVGYALLTAATVGDAVKLALGLQKELGTMLQLNTKVVPEGIAVTASTSFHAPEIYVFLIEEAFASLFAIGIGLAGNDFRPVQVKLAFNAPEHAEAYHKAFKCPVIFGATYNAFIFDPAWFERKLEHADIFSHREALEFIAYSRSRTRVATEVIESVERVLRQNLSNRIGLAGVARELGMSERTLRRRLNENGVSFQAVLDGLRKNKALELLGNLQVSIEQIAFLVGFTDAHSFRRAFRHWTGSTPTLLRASMTEI